MALAIRSGMCLLLFSCVLGFAMVLHGNQQITLGKPPEIYGAAGVMKFPHGVPIHSIQFLPFLGTLQKHEMERSLQEEHQHSYSNACVLLSNHLSSTRKRTILPRQFHKEYIRRTRLVMSGAVQLSSGISIEKTIAFHVGKNAVVAGHVLQ